ncbi:phospholipase D-like domain-containing protein [Rhodococcus rhodochrous]|uniref:Phosphatidylserine/phosphatidylglycerophosphate/ cardiolipin synthase-like enzyme n=1 Tax=Rhodococcus rhodochrous J45 TaxID=935266 RepID=A0A562DJ51_RHORH|nr:phospholipase D-like domain-containing protein [Rhodococcus rhodochrous]TWH09688.1 phosphatidylserine/phosphatidylglycerophosphate/cardiolipin synthase-like enzyme [Rhodococcus rhodochrous J45]
MAETVLEPGSTCWRIARAERLTCIVDAADYFRHAKAAMLRAEKRIMLIGWDFDTRIKFEPEGATLEGPNKLGEFLEWLPERRPGLDIYLLKWNIGAFSALARGMTPVFVLDWLTDPSLHFEIDGAHPVGAAHHQKILVVDDSIAFCGGIDMTVDRWDTPDHPDRSKYRREPSGKRYGPWHDVTTAVDGDAARALGDQARARWKAATGEELDPVPEPEPIWPDDLEPTLHGVDVGIARTLPAYDGKDGVHEIEALYLSVIEKARHTLYLESQYLASRRIADALAERLQEPDGPEIVVVIPRNAEGWLERKAMDGARRALLHMLWEADVHGRFAAYYPVTAGGEPIYVHAKVVVMDETLLRIGSSNLNNRSMGFDTECDLAIESAEPGDAVGRAAVELRNILVAEHLDVDPEVIAEATKDGGSLISTIERLRGPGRSLRPFEPGTVSDEDSVLAESALADPERASRSFGRRIERFFAR